MVARNKRLADDRYCQLDLYSIISLSSLPPPRRTKRAKDSNQILNGHLRIANPLFGTVETDACWPGYLVLEGGTPHFATDCDPSSPTTVAGGCWPRPCRLGHNRSGKKVGAYQSGLWLLSRPGEESKLKFIQLGSKRNNLAWHRFLS
jgi:hypothetical protein